MPRDSAAADRPASYLVGTAAAFPLFFRDRTKPINQLPFSPSAKFPKSGSSCESRVSKVSDLLGISESTIVQHDRNLVVAGLRSKSGRGTSAARMTPRDAAHLLVAVLSSHHVKDSAQTVRRYSETRLHKTQSEGYADSSVAALMNLQPGHSFVDALEALISAAAEGSLQTAIYEALP